MLVTFVFCILAYLAGSITFGILIPKWLGYADPRTQGSKNPGATNVFRYTNKAIAALVLIGDLLKGWAIVFIASMTHVPETWLSWIALLTVIGHMYPIFFQFKGGKGVATALGSILALEPFIGLIILSIWLSVFLLFHYSSLSAIIACFLTPFIMYLSASPHWLAISIMAYIILIKHRNNIARLVKGQETKIVSINEND